MSVFGLGVSVLIPVYNRYGSLDEFNLLNRALNSTIEQDYFGPMEIVLVDDGSPIPIEQLFARLGSKTPNIRFIRHGENRGLVPALNSALKAASYPLIARLDADDCWRPGKMTAQLQQFQEDPDLSLSATGMTRVKPDGKEIDTHIRPATWAGILDFFVHGGCPFPHGSVVARKDIYRLVGGYSYDARVSHCEDYALWGTWIRFFKPAMIKQSLYEYTVSNSSVSSTYAAQQQKASAIVRNVLATSGVGASLPSDFERLAAILGTSLLGAGAVSYLMWKNAGMALDLPPQGVDAVARIMPDRHIVEAKRPSKPWQSILQEKLGLKSKQMPDEPSISVRAAIA